MFDLYQCHWITDQEHKLFIANAPSLKAPLRFDMQCQSRTPSRRLAEHEAAEIYQAAMQANMTPMTFLSSRPGIGLVQQIIAQSSYSAAS